MVAEVRQSLIIPDSFTPTLRQKILFLIPFIGIIPSHLFERAIQMEIHKAKSTSRIVHLLTKRSRILNISSIRELLSSVLLLSLLATDRIKKPNLRLFFVSLSIYFIYSGMQKGELIEIIRERIRLLNEKRSPSPH